MAMLKLKKGGITMQKTIWTISLSVALLALAACQDSTAPAQSSHVIIDTDMGYDDAMAILYLLQRPDIEVEAITVTGTGMAYLEPGTQNALALLTLAQEEHVIVARGSNTPLAGDHTTMLPDVWHDEANTMLGVSLPQTELTAIDTAAAELMRELIRNAREPVTIITLGPLTNVAQALMDEPSIVEHIHGIYIMGGAVDVEGNVQYGGDASNVYAEWNIFLDPMAANIVFSSPAPITLVPLDATNDTPATTAFADRLAVASQTPEAAFVSSLLEALRAQQALDDWFYFWDALAAAIATAPSLATLERKGLMVVTDEGPESGRTKQDGSSAPIDVATGAHASAFEELFLQVLNGDLPGP